MRLLASLPAVLLLALFLPPVQAENRRYLVYEDFTEFLTAAIPPDWAVEDANGDGVTWEAVEWGGVRGGPAVRYLSNPGGAADDWLASPPLELEPDVDYRVTFHARVTDPTLPHTLHVLVGTAIGGGETVLNLPAIMNTDPEMQEATFTVDAPGTYYVQFRVTTPADFFALYLSRIIVSEPEENLELILELDADFYEPGEPAVFGEGGEIRCMMLVRNNGTQTVTLNSSLAAGHESDPDAVQAYRVTGPDSEPVPSRGRITLVPPLDEDFEEVPPGEAVFAFDDLAESFFDLSAPGVYTVRAVYRNVHLPETGTAWRGKLVSEPVSFTIEEEPAP